MKYYETLITVSVLSVEEPFAFESFEQLAAATFDGPVSGMSSEETVIEHTRESFDEKCVEHGTDLAFFSFDDVED